MQALIAFLKQKWQEQEQFHASDFTNIQHLISLEELNGLLPAQHPSCYSKNILLLDPFEIALLRWPTKCKSAIHEHIGFQGYVLILQGTARNRCFQLEKQVLQETSRTSLNAYSYFYERDGDIHMIENPSSEEELITLHIYYPPLETLDNLKLFHPNGSIGILNEQAEAADWTVPESQFKDQQENQFQFSPFEEQESSHFIHYLVPKPSTEALRKEMQAYYSEQAFDYDELDRKYRARSAYLNAINQLIIDDIKGRPVNAVLDIACGTGRRGQLIQLMTKSEFLLHGVDMNPEMCSIEKERGYQKLVNSRFVETPLASLSRYEAVFHLYAFGHIPSEAERVQILDKIFTVLQPGGRFYLDVFNLEDEDEWGPEIEAAHEALNLEQFNYQPGDVLYQRKRGNHCTFLHYFTKEEIRNLLQQSGFNIIAIKQVTYGKNPGEIVNNSKRGKLFIIAERPA